MKMCPVVGCDVLIREAEVICHSCLASVSRHLRFTFVSCWRVASRTFDPTALAAYDRARRAVIVAAGQAKRPQSLPFDDT